MTGACGVCGASAASDARFCASCGAPVGEVARTPFVRVDLFPSFEGAFPDADDAVFLVGLEDAAILDANPAAVDICGHERVQLLELTLMDLQADRDDAAMHAFFARLRGVGVARFERKLSRANGQELPIEIGATLCKRGVEELAIIRMRDLSADRDAERALAHSERRYRDLVEASRDLIWSVDASCRLLFINRASEDVYGYSPDELTGRSILDLAANDSVRLDRENFEALRVGDDRADWETKHIRADGQPVHLRFSAVVRRGDDGRPVGATGTASDITDQHHVLVQKRRLERQIHRAQRLESIDKLTGGITHGFNNLLVGILGGAELALREMAVEAPGRMDVERIRSAATEAAELTRQMSAYSGTAPTAAEKLDLSRLVLEASHLLEASVSQRARLRFDLADNLHPVIADAAQVRQAVINLVTNAGEAIAGGEGVVTVRTGHTDISVEQVADLEVAEEISPGQFAMVEVLDTGVGMDAPTRARIFDPFFTTKVGGRGLGLAAAIGVVRAHCGAVDVMSEPTRGSRFRLLFPIAESVHPTAARRLTPAFEAPAGTVLVVDDDATVRAVASEMLGRTGFRVLLAEHGAEAVDVYRAQGGAIRLVLMDMTMPIMSGQEAFRAIRQLDPEATILLSSGYDEKEAVSGYFAEGLAGFIQKPYRYQTLLESVQHALA